MREPVHKAIRKVWRDGVFSDGARLIPEETPLALTYNGGTYAVMMGSPEDLGDFAVGFSLSEGIVQSTEEIETLDIVELDDGIELRMWLRPDRAERIAERRRNIAGPTGCGLCGLDSISEAVRPAAVVPTGRIFSPREIMTAVAAVAPLQEINHQTRAVHAAAFWTATRGIVALREDVGRHNALDKLAGAVSADGHSAPGGAVLLTSRVSVEKVQKTAVIGVPFVIAMSPPTTLAIGTAEGAGITLLAMMDTAYSRTRIASFWPDDRRGKPLVDR